MGKYYCPCGAILDTDEMIKLGFYKAMSILIDHFECLNKYESSPAYEKYDRNDCEHDKVSITIDGTVVGRGSMFPAIRVKCLWCGSRLSIFDFPPGKDRNDIVKFIKSGKIKLDWNRHTSGRYYMDTTIFVNGNDKDKKEIYRLLKNARLG